MVMVKTRSWAVAWIGAMTLAGAVLPATHSAQAREAQAPAAHMAPGSGVQLAGLLGWLSGKKKTPAPQAPQQVPEPQLTPAPPQPAPGQAPAGQRRAVPPVGGGTYRTLCVRSCDGFYFPISFKVTRSTFRADAAACRNRCSGGDARLFVYRNPGQEVRSAVDLQGNRYVDQKNAFRYRKELVQGCGCEPGAWAETGAESQ